MKLNVTKDANATWKELQENRTYGAFYLKTANKAMEDASKLPDPCALFDVFWSEGEICILFGDTNTGKSALATQVANLHCPISYAGQQLSWLRQTILSEPLM